jgi:hypothetical protein
MSWRPEVISDGSEQWMTNALRFATKEEAEAYAFDLSKRWMGVCDTRAIETDDSVNSRFVDGELIEVEGESAA